MCAGGCSLSLPPPCFIEPRDDHPGRDTQRITEPEQEVQRRRALVVFELADVAAIHAGGKGQLLLAHSGGHACLAQLVAQPGGTVADRRSIIDSLPLEAPRGATCQSLDRLGGWTGWFVRTATAIAPLRLTPWRKDTRTRRLTR